MRPRIYAGDRLDIVYWASATPGFVKGVIELEYDDGTLGTLEVFENSFTADRTSQLFLGQTASKSGYVTGGFIDMDATGVKRGNFYFTMRLVGRIRGHNTHLATDYLYDSHLIPVGTFVHSLEGPGWLDWIQEANDAAGSATTTVNLAATNARRLVRAIIIKYHASGDSATRTLTATLRDLADSGGPTGWSIASDTWVSPTLTLTVNEEGLMHVGEHGFVSTNDAGTLAYADNTTAPNPFPFFVEEGETADLIVAVGSGHANDDYDVWVQYEEWIDV